MFLAELDQRVTELRGVGPALGAHLARVGVATVRDLLLHLPRGYEDRRVPVPLERAAGAEGKSYVEVTVVSLDHVGRGWRATPRAVVTDGATEGALLCFGRAFLGRVLQPQRRFRVWGTFKPGRLGPESSDFELESVSVPPASFGRTLPGLPAHGRARAGRGAPGRAFGAGGGTAIAGGCAAGGPARRPRPADHGRGPAGGARPRGPW